LLAPEKLRLRKREEELLAREACCSQAAVDRFEGRCMDSAPRRQVEPLPLSILKRGQANPGQYSRVVAVQIENHVGRRAVEEVKTTRRPEPR
jgi:hypothetical protein